MDLGISGKKAIVCASSRGLGKACAMSLGRAGAAVTINGRDETVLAATADEIVRATGAEVTAVAADVGTPEGQAKLLDACPAPDILVNNNGGPPFRDFREIDRKAMLEGVTMNMVTPIELIQSVIDGMIARRFGRIVNITSISVKMPVVGLDLSSGGRAGLTAFLAGVARSVADRNVTINNLLPGYFDTDRLRAENEVAEDTAAGIPAKRFGDPAEFGEACAFLCAASSGYITGQSLLIDGGKYNSAF